MIRHIDIIDESALYGLFIAVSNSRAFAEAFLSASKIQFYLANGVHSNFTLPAIFHSVYHGNFPGESVDDLWIATNRSLPFICSRFLSFVLPL